MLTWNKYEKQRLNTCFSLQNVAKMSNLTLLKVKTQEKHQNIRDFDNFRLYCSSQCLKYLDLWMKRWRSHPNIWSSDFQFCSFDVFLLLISAAHWVFRSLEEERHQRYEDQYDSHGVLIQDQLRNNWFECFQILHFSANTYPKSYEGQ